MELVFVNPAAVYGPGPLGGASLERQLFQPLVRGRLPALVPGGFGVVYSEGVGAGQLLAAERGRPGERYILCDEHVTLRELAQAVVRVAGRGRVPPTVTESEAVVEISGLAFVTTTASLASLHAPLTGSLLASPP